MDPAVATRAHTLACIAATAIHTHKALQKLDELAGLLALIRRGDVVVEVGCDAGGTLWAFAAVGAGRVIGVDLPRAGWGTGQLPDPHGAAMVTGDSHDPATRARLVALLGADPIDVLFIDGDHTYDGVIQDWQMYGPLVRPGGLVAFHDICPHPDHPEVGVGRLWGDLADRLATSEIVAEPRTWGGIGVLRCG